MWVSLERIGSWLSNDAKLMGTMRPEKMIVEKVEFLFGTRNLKKNVQSGRDNYI